MSLKKIIITCLLAFGTLYCFSQRERIVFDGDSNTEGVGTMPGFEYPTQAFQQFGGNYEFVNLGIGGYTTTDILVNAPLKYPSVINSNSTYILLAGINDVQQIIDGNLIYDNIAALVDLVKSLGCYRIIVGTYPLYNGIMAPNLAHINANRVQLNQLIRQHAAAKGYVVADNDASAEFGSWSPAYFSDYIHWNNAGAAVVAANTKNAFLTLPTGCNADVTPPVIVSKNATVYLHNGTASLSPSKIIEYYSDNCSFDTSSLVVSQTVLTTSDITPLQSSNFYQSYSAASSHGNQVYFGEVGMEFSVNNPGGIIISQMGAFDHLGNGISGLINGGVRVAIYKKNNRTIVPGLDVIIAGSSDTLVENHRMKAINPVTLLPGNYVLVAKGYNNNELVGNRVSGFPAANSLQNGAGALSFNASCYGADDANGFYFPKNYYMASPNVFAAGTFTFAPVLGTTITISGKDVSGNTTQVSANVVVRDSVSSIVWVGTSGNWSDQANWSTGILPGISDKIQLSAVSPVTIVIDGNFSVNDLVIGNNVTLIMASGRFTVTGNFLQTGGIIQQGNNILEVKGNFTRIGGIFSAGTGTTEITGIAQILNNVGAATTFNHLKISGGLKTIITGDGNAFSANGNFVVETGANLALSNNISTGILIGGNLVYNSDIPGLNIDSLTLILSGTNNTITTGVGSDIPNIRVAQMAVYNLASDLEIPTSKRLTIAGKVNAGNHLISGGGTLQLSNPGILGIAATSGGFGSVVTTTNKVYPSANENTAFIEYNAMGNQQIDASTHPARLGIRTGGTGIKTLNGNVSLDGYADAGNSNELLYVSAGTTFNDGGNLIRFVNSNNGAANVHVGGVYKSEGAGGIAYMPTGNFSPSTISFIDGTEFGDLSINQHISATINLKSLPGGTTANGSFRNINFEGDEGGLLNVNTSGHTPLTVRGNVNFVLTNTASSGGGFGGTVSTNGTVRIKGNIASNSLSVNQPLFNNVGVNTLILEGTNPQTISLAANNATILTGATLQLDNLNGFHLSQDVTFAGILHISRGKFYTGSNNFTLGTEASVTVAAGSSFHIDQAASTVNFAGRPVTFKSSASGTASLAPVVGNLINATNVTVERYIPANGRRAWRLLASTLDASQAPTIHASWQEGGSSIANGTHITQAGGASTNGFDSSGVSGSTSIRYYDGSDLQPLLNTNVNTVSDNGGAHFLFIRGDRTIAINSTSASNNTTLRMTGTVNHGDKLVGVQGAFSLIPNPYPSSVDFETIIAHPSNASLASGQFYIWDANMGYFGGFRTIQRIAPNVYQSTPSTGVDSTMRYIKSGQAFFIPVNTQVHFSEAMKTELTPATDVFRAGTGTEEMTINLKVVDGSANGILVDGVRSVYNNNFLASVNSDDAPKFNNLKENLAITRDDKILSVEKRPLIDVADTIFLKLWNVGIKNYRFDINPSNFSPTQQLSAYLIDKFLGTMTPVGLDVASHYDFSITSNSASAAEDRFLIVYNVQGTLPVAFIHVNATSKNAGIKVDWNVGAEQQVEKYEVEKSVNATDFYKTGEVVANNSKSYQWFDSKPGHAGNYYRIRVVNRDNSYSFSSIVYIKSASINADIAIFPNPVRGKVMHVQFTNMESGVYSLQLFNVLGQIVQNSQIAINGGVSAKSIHLNNSVSKGNYQMVISKNELKIIRQVTIE